MDLPFSFDLDALAIIATDSHQTVPTMKVGEEVWFCAKPCALILGYTNTQKAIRDHVDEEWQMPLSQLLKSRPNETDPPGGPVYRKPNDLAAKWIMWSGLLELCTESKMPLAKKFKKWVYGEVLPAIMKTGSYSIHGASDNGTPDESWNQERLDGIHLFKLKNASLKELTACCFGGQQARTLYKVVGGAINRALLDFHEATKDFQRRHHLPGHMSIPSLLAFDGQVLRKQMERRYMKYLRENWSELQTSLTKDVIYKLEELGGQMQEGNRMSGYTVKVSELMKLEEARARQRDLMEARKGSLKPSSGVIALEHVPKKQKTLFDFQPRF